MGWIESESLGLICPHFADEFVGRQAFERRPSTARNFVYVRWSGGVVEDASELDGW